MGNAETMGATIARLRKELGMTQAQLAAAMSVTDKAVSKWERDLSRPDSASIPQLAEVLGVSIDELMNAGAKASKPGFLEEHAELIDTILVGVGLAMGVATFVLSLLGQLDLNSAAGMLGIGLSCIALSLLAKKKGGAA